MNDRFKYRVWDKETKDFNCPFYLDKNANLYYDSWCEGLEQEEEEERYIIQQCTGLKDKNGNLIYEGDIVKTNYGDIGTIKYSTHFSRWQIIFKQGRKHLVEYKEIGVHIFDFTYPKMHLEIIGNIYENPDMVEEK